MVCGPGAREQRNIHGKEGARKKALTNTTQVGEKTNPELENIIKAASTLKYAGSSTSLSSLPTLLALSLSSCFQFCA